MAAASDRRQWRGWISRVLRVKGKGGPKWRGRLELDGKTLYLSGWLKTDPYGRQYLGLEATEVRHGDR